MRLLRLTCSLAFSVVLLAQSPQDIPTTIPVHLKSVGLTPAVLAKDCTLMGHELGAGTRIRLRPDGSLQGFSLVRDTPIVGIPLPKNTVVALAPKGFLDWCFLPRDTEIQGHLLKGKGDNWMTGFHPNGRLRLAWLARDEVIDGVPCQQTTFIREFLRLQGWGGTVFHANGRLASCALAVDAVVQGRSLKKNTRVHFDRDGNLLPN